MYIDFHAHILPAIDDGSENTGQSIRMLLKSREQMVSTIVGTPHFDPINTNVSDFLIKREHSLEILKMALEGSALDKTTPNILCGAECKYIKKISRYPDVEKLCIEGTSYLLLELPYSDWNDDVFEEIYLLTVKRGIFSMIAHPNRFLDQIKKQNAMGKFAELDCLMQLNVDSLTHIIRRKKGLYLLSGSVPCVLGSDMHGDGPDEQMISRAMSVIERKSGLKVKQRILKISEAVLKNSPPWAIKDLL